MIKMPGWVGLGLRIGIRVVLVIYHVSTKEETEMVKECERRDTGIQKRRKKNKS
jgi:hypothetical protein